MTEKGTIGNASDRNGLTRPGKAGLASIAFRVVALLLLASVMFFSETGFDPAETCSGVEFPSGQLSSADYLLTIKLSSFHEPNDQMVRIVTLTPRQESDEILSNVCIQRTFIAKLVRKLKSSGASIIILDKMYSESACRNQPNGTNDLLHAIEERGSPVVVGLATDLLAPSDRKMLGSRTACLSPTPHVVFPNASYGLTRVDSDTRRLPLEWPVVAPNGDVTLIPTLALAAATRANPNLKSRTRLQTILNSGKPPFSKFNPRKTFEKYSAVKILCGPTAGPNTEWADCPEASDANSEILQGKIVVVGDFSEADKHATVLGPMYGVELQANYIAALLSDDIYVPLGETLSGAIYAVLWFILVQSVFAFWPGALSCRALICGTIWAVILLLSLGSLTYYGYLVTVLVQGLNLGVIA